MANVGQAVAQLLVAVEDASDQVVAEISALGATTVQFDNLADRLGQRTRRCSSPCASQRTLIWPKP